MRRRREPVPTTPEAILETYHRIAADAAELDDPQRRSRYIAGALALYRLDMVEVIRARRWLSGRRH